MGSAWAIGAGALAILLLVYFYRVRTAAPRLVYQQRALPLIGDSGVLLNDVEIQYQGQRLPRVTKTYVVLWNAGRLVRKPDVTAEDPLRFEVTADAAIISAQVAKRSDASNVSVTPPSSAEPNTVTITFDELGPGEGAVLEVLHTSAERFGTLRGSITGMAGAPQNRGRVRQPFNPLPSQVPAGFKAIGNTAFVLIFGIGALLVILSAFGSSLTMLLGPHVGPVMTVIEGISDVIYASFALIILAQTKRRFPEDLMIPELVE